MGKKRKGKQETIDIETEASNAMAAYLENRGGRGIKKFVLSRLVKWFAFQPDSVKDAVIGWVPGEAKGNAAAVIRKIADDLVGDVEVVSGKMPKKPS